MKKGLTTRAIEAAKPSSARREIPDALLPGLYLVVQPSGAKSWAVRYRHHGRPRKHTLGKYPALNLVSARQSGAKVLRAAAEGEDPASDKRQALATRKDSLETIAVQFIERHAKQNNRERTWRETERLLRTSVLPRWRGRTIHDISRKDVLRLLDDIVDKGSPIVANRTLSAIRKLFNWAVSRDILAMSPCTGIKPPTAERSRDRVLSDDELRAVWEGSEKLGWPFGPMVKILILTAQRRDEVAGMRWDELDLDGGIWALPPERVKNNKPHEVPLSNATVEILRSLPAAPGHLVFTTTGITSPSGFSKAKSRLDAMIEKPLKPWRLHDLRRTAATGMARLGIAMPVVEKILNHTSGSFRGVAAVYQRHDYREEKRLALQAWGAHVSVL
jgi:integrase